MQRTIGWMVAALLITACTAPLFAATTEVFRNDKVMVTEVKLAPGGLEPADGVNANLVVVLTGDRLQIRLVHGFHSQFVKRGDTINLPEGAQSLTNTGPTPLRLVRVEFLAAGSDESWGMTGLPPNYKILIEDRHSRTYEIKIPAHAWEPQHTHHARVVICLNGAQLEHVLPDGTRQPSTLKTDEVTWRPAQTHTGHNLGDTDLWCIAIEPK